MEINCGLKKEVSNKEDDKEKKVNKVRMICRLHTPTNKFKFVNAKDF